MSFINKEELIQKIRELGLLGSGHSDSEREDDLIDNIVDSCQEYDNEGHITVCRNSSCPCNYNDQCDWFGNAVACKSRI